MTINTKTLRELALDSNDGYLRGPALEAADTIDAHAAEIARKHSNLLDALEDAAKARMALRGAAAEVARLREALQFGVDLYDHDKSVGELAMALYEFCNVARAALQGESRE